MSKKIILAKLDKLYKETKSISITDEDKIVIFSDLHIGDNTDRDDFQHNSEMFEFLLQYYYLNRNYKLVLNGDIEELYKYPLKKIISSRNNFYNLLNQFDDAGNLFKIYGNHDYELNLHNAPKANSNLLSAVKFDYKGDDIFIFHGHQTAHFIEQYNLLALLLVRYIIYPLGIKNYSFPANFRKKFITESLAYEFSKERKIISILGHTHRPLFESLSKADTLKMLIEKMIRKYSLSDELKKEIIKEKIKKYSSELNYILQKDNAEKYKSSIYDDNFLVPCLFNSGSAIGKRGFTGIEIAKGKISLVYWFDINRSQRYIDYKGVKIKQFPETDYYKAILKRQPLDYIFTRIKLLS